LARRPPGSATLSGAGPNRPASPGRLSSNVKQRTTAVASQSSNRHPSQQRARASQMSRARSVPCPSSKAAIKHARQRAAVQAVRQVPCARDRQLARPAGSKVSLLVRRHRKVARCGYSAHGRRMNATTAVCRSSTRRRAGVEWQLSRWFAHLPAEALPNPSLEARPSEATRFARASESVIIAHPGKAARLCGPAQLERWAA
jgi:hypothetical protein